MTIMSDEEQKKTQLPLKPSQLLVVAGLLSGVFEVISVLINKDQTVAIVLQGSLKRNTPTEKATDQAASQAFDDVIKTIVGGIY